jgi:hypothetical protein
MQKAGLAVNSDVSFAVESVFSGGAAWKDTLFWKQTVVATDLYWLSSFIWHLCYQALITDIQGAEKRLYLGT